MCTTENGRKFRKKNFKFIFDILLSSMQLYFITTKENNKLSINIGPKEATDRRRPFSQWTLKHIATLSKGIIISCGEDNYIHVLKHKLK